MTDKKIDEKEMEKREEKYEKECDEKSWDEKYARDPPGTIVWALIFIWAGWCCWRQISACSTA